VRTQWAILTVAALVVALAPTGTAHWEEAYHWGPGVIPMHLQQGASPGPLIDGNGDWDTVTESALNAWNDILNGVVFEPVRDSSPDSAIQDGVNNVIFGDAAYGEPFGEGVLAITLTTYTTPDNVTIETDVVFNRKISWNSYRGDLRPAANGGMQYDLGRIALHEFGHVLGLAHPDDHGQAVAAIMNSRASNLDALQPDDIEGVKAMYTGAAETQLSAAHHR
jgi:hypothetical protein